MSGVNVAVELIAALFTAVATMQLWKIWQMGRIPRPMWSPWSERGWVYIQRSIVPLVASLYGFLVAFPAAWFSDRSSTAAAVLIVASLWVVVCLALSCGLALRRRPVALVPPAWRGS